MTTLFASSAPKIPKTVCKFELGWDGKPLFGTHENPVAIDTETSIDTDLDPATINRLALVQVSDGSRTILIHPDDLVRFLEAHSTTPFVGHNIAYDFWVVNKHLELAGRKDLVKVWWERANTGLLHDTMIVDALVRLAEGRGETGEDGDKFYMRGLGDVSRDYSGIVLDKSDPYRKRYVEIIGKRLGDVTDHGFWSYAALDAYATAHTWPALYRVALGYSTRFARGVGLDGEKRLTEWLSHGVLTEQIQIKGAIAFSQVERNGIPFCPDEARKDEARWRPVIADSVAEIEKLRPAFFKKKNGRYEMADKSGVPKINQGDLIQALSDAGTKIKEAVPEFQPPQSYGKTFFKTGEAVSRSPDDWEPYAKYDPFLSSWAKLASTSKRLGFYANFRAPEKNLYSEFEAPPDYRIRSRINLLMRTGRTSYQTPNIQQIPRDKDFRAIFRAPPGKKILTIDYSFIELRTLAAICLDRFGKSTLGDVIKKGIDPHAYTAAMINNVPFADFMKLKKAEPEKFKESRQAAKAINFGVPGGLGGLKLSAYAAANYGVNLSVQDATKFKQKLISEVYPELNDRDGYLADDTFAALALNTGLSRGEILSALPGGSSMRPWIGRVLGRIVSGATNKVDGDPYDADFFESCWDFLEGLGRKSPSNGPLSEVNRKKLRLRKGDTLLSRELTLGHAYTLTGRIRSKVKYTISKNTPFQGLAADGGKNASYVMVSKGYKVLAFIHDEILVELDEATADIQAEDIKEIMCEEMEKVLGGSIPCAVEYHVGDFWAK